MTSARTTASVSFGISRRTRSSIFSSSARIDAASLGGLVVADGAGQALERRVGGDLQRLGGAGVLGVLEHLLLAAGAAQEIERRLAERERLADDRLDDADDRHQRVAALPSALQAAPDAVGVVARLAQVRLQRGAVGAARRHRDLRLQHAHERLLGGVRLVEVLHDLLLGLFCCPI